MNLFKGLLALLGYGQNEQEKTYETPFKDLRNPETGRKPEAFNVEPVIEPIPAPTRKPKAHTVERAPEKPAPTPRKPQAVQTGRDDDTLRRNSAQDDLLLNPATSPALFPVVFGTHSAGAAEKTPETSHNAPSSDFSKAVDDTPAPSHTTYDHGSSSSPTYDSGSSGSTTTVDTTPTYSPPADTGSFGGFDGGSSAAFAPA